MRLAEAPAGGAACSSISVFQAPQSSQRPDHLGCAAPQDWQTKARAPRANLGPYPVGFAANHRRTSILMGPSAEPWMNWSTKGLPLWSISFVAPSQMILPL